MADIKHSPLPWRTELVEGRLKILDANGLVVDGWDEHVIRLIVIACNHFDDMRELLERVTGKLNRQDMYEELQQEVWQFLDKIDELKEESWQE